MLKLPSVKKVQAIQVLVGKKNAKVCKPGNTKDTFKITKYHDTILLVCQGFKVKVFGNPNKIKRKK